MRPGQTDVDVCLQEIEEATQRREEALKRFYEREAQRKTLSVPVRLLRFGLVAVFLTTLLLTLGAWWVISSLADYFAGR